MLLRLEAFIQKQKNSISRSLPVRSIFLSKLTGPCESNINSCLSLKTMSSMAFPMEQFMLCHPSG
jgi:hypothetical protein